MKGSILSRAIDVADLEDDFIKMVIYGQNRVGKTWLGCDFPKPLLLVSMEPCKTGGARTVVGRKGVTFIKITKTDDALKLADELSRDDHYATVVIDGATSYQDLFLREILGVDTLPEQMSFGGVSSDAYRMRSEKVKEGLRPFLNMDKNVIVLAKEKDHNPPKEEKITQSGKIAPDMRPKFLRGVNTESFISTDLGGSAMGWLHDACDFVGRLSLDKEVIVEANTVKVRGQESTSFKTTETGRIVRRLRLVYHPNFAAGIRSPKGNVPEHIDDPTYEKILQVVKGEYPTE